MKFDWLITFRSITFAQRGQQAFTNIGIDSRLRRTPSELTRRGCGYCLALRQGDVPAGVEILRSRGIAFGKVFSGSGGHWEERTL